MRTLPVVIGVLALGAAACASPEEVEEKQEERQASIEDDVAIESCSTDAAGWMTATVKITNNSDDPSTYSVDVAFESPDGATQLGTGTAFADELQNGQATSVEANSLKAPTGEFKCRVADVSRFAS